jgi:hypothetical protein
MIHQVVVRDDSGNFEGFQPGCPGEHRTVGERAWCSACTCWCYPDEGCTACRLAQYEEL